MNQSDQTTLEQMIDGATLARVIEALAEIARGKAAHIRENRQAHMTGQPWDAAATKLEKLAARLDV